MTENPIFEKRWKNRKCKHFREKNEENPRKSRVFRPASFLAGTLAYTKLQHSKRFCIVCLPSEKTYFLSKIAFPADILEILADLCYHIMMLLGI